MHEQYQNTKFFSSLDAIRCIAIIAVIWHHCPVWIELQIEFLSRGFLGVDMFFVLSGFLITTLLIRERRSHGSISLKAFWARRSLRIFPIYYLSLIGVFVLVLIGMVGDKGSEKFTAALPYHIFYLSNWIHEPGPNLIPLWSLATEEQFYLFWPLLERYAPAKVKLTIYGLLLAVNQAINFDLIWPYLPEDVSNHLQTLEIMDTTFTPLLLGVGLAYALDHRAVFDKFALVLAHRWSSVIVGAIMFTAILFIPGDISGAIRLLFQILMTLFIASCVMRENQIFKPFATFPPIRLIGVISYGMYLYHMWAIDLSNRLVINPLGLSDYSNIIIFPLALVGTILVAYLSFKFIEQPCLAYKKKFSRTASEQTVTEEKSD